MTEGDALYRAVLADPDDDTPRLAYADWLDETGQDDRAEFIRAQVELARSPTLALRAKEQALLALHGEEWLSPLKAENGPLHGDTHGKFRRGFVEVVWMPAATFLGRAEALFAAMPVRELRVTRATAEEVSRLALSPFLEQLSGLDLSDRRLGDSALWILPHSRHARALRVLRLRGCELTDDGANRLTIAGSGWSLHELDVSHNPISPAGVAALRERYGDAVRAEGMPAE